MSHDEFCSSTPTIESGSAAVADFASLHVAGANSEIQRAINLFYAVRDIIRYDPYHIDLSENGMKATTTLSTGRGWCVSKAILLAACCRSIGIAARLGFADVRNHLSTERMRKTMRTDIFYWHGYTEMLLEEKWIKTTPAFNIELCEKFRLLPLEFDGINDSLYHPFDADGNKHMEYVNYRGTYSDAPLDKIARTFHEEYAFDSARHELRSANFEADVENESVTGRN